MSHHHHHQAHHTQEKANNPFWNALHKTTASQLTSSTVAVTVLKSNASVEYAVRTLAEKKVLSVPVVDHKDESQVLGLIDVLDVVSFIIRVAPDVKDIKENELRSLEMCGRAMAFAEVKEVLDASGRDPYVPVYSDSPATFPTDLLASGVHRVPLFAAGSSNLTAILSQSDVIRFVYAQINHGGDLHHVCQKSLTELGLSSTNVFSVTTEQTVLSALKVLDDKRVSALAVVDATTGRLVGNFSASDLKGLYQEQFPSLLLSVGEYLEKHSAGSLKPCVVLPTASLQVALGEMVDNRLHRLWIVDGEFRPQGIVSQTDVVKLFRDYSQ